MRICILCSLLLSLLCLFSCDNASERPLLFEVKSQPFTVEIPATGSLFAAQATVISVPQSSSQVHNIAWLAAEFSLVKKGEVIARFDDESIQVQSRNKSNQFAMNEQDIIKKKGALHKQLDAINKDIIMVRQERVFAENFSIDDERIVSKLDIINSMQNTVYLGAKQSYLDWKSDSFSESSAGDMGLLEMKKQQYQHKLNQLSNDLSLLEIQAPHDGLLSYATNWRGEKPKAGQVIWSGQKIAELPNINEMKAKLFVIESEALDLVAGKSVSLQLFAFMDQPFTGVIESVAAFPKSIKRGEPQKYFEVVVKLTKQNAQLFVPGRKLKAQILIDKAQNKLTVPLQSVFSKDNHSYVFVYQQGEFIKADVTTGKASLSHVEIVSGLKVGQRISLIDREAS
jgi:multidrug efflux pump subunit AcrA (membrane-fusion protein)